MLSSSSLLLQRTRQLRHYVTRAHPKPTPVFPIIDALKEVLKGTEERLIKRAKKWERNKEERARQGKIKVRFMQKEHVCATMCPGAMNSLSNSSKTIPTLFTRT
jgi:ribonucleotide reductase alpha subunit